MKKEDCNLGVALVHYICPICGSRIEKESSIIMNQVLTSKLKKEVEDAHNKVMGYSENACEKCLELKNEGVFLLEYYPEEKERGNRYLCMKKDSKFIKDVRAKSEDYILKTKNGVEYMYVDKELYGEFMNVMK